VQTSLAKQEMISREMGHRIKNLFAVAEGLVRMTAHEAKTKAEFPENLSGRFPVIP